MYQHWIHADEWVERQLIDREIHVICLKSSLLQIYRDLVAQPYADTGDDETVALTGVENTNFPELKLWVLDVVKNNVVCQISLILYGLFPFSINIKQKFHCASALSELLEQIIDVLGHLVRYGYYDNEKDVDEVMGPLIELLHGKTGAETIGNI